MSGGNSASAAKSAMNGAKGSAPDEPPKPVQPCGQTWIEIELVDEEGQPVPGTKYKITTPDGQVKQGQLNSQGVARVDSINPGNCTITFPELDKDAWESL